MDLLLRNMIAHDWFDPASGLIISVVESEVFNIFGVPSIPRVLHINQIIWLCCKTGHFDQNFSQVPDKRKDRACSEV